MKSITIISGSLIGLLSAEILSKKYNVTIIEINQELGFPSNFPGMANKLETINDLLESKDISKLNIFQSENLISFRTEWFSKLLTHKLARNGVNIFHRTRIDNVSINENKILLNLKGSNFLNKTHYTDYILDTSDTSTLGPLNSTHTDFLLKSKLYHIPKLTTKQYFVGTCLRKDSIKLNNYELKLERSDGLVELWYYNTNEEFPNHGWIESKSINVFYNSKIMNLEEHISETQKIIKKLVI
tara:strand:- start:1283 stop:2008 length:726 start_codon:yes stop_codon:yes gene_type:complete